MLPWQGGPMGDEYRIRWSDPGWPNAHREQIERVIRELPTFVGHGEAKELWLKDDASRSTWPFDVRVFIDEGSLLIEVSSETRAFSRDVRRLFWILAAAPYFWADVAVPTMRLEEEGDPD